LTKHEEIKDIISNVLLERCWNKVFDK